MSSRPRLDPGTDLLAALLFFMSGFAALIYQVIWQRVLGIFSGVHIYSITMIVTAFMAGLGVGSLLGGRYADRLSRSRSVLGFGACEVGIGVFALFSTWLYYDIAYLKLGFLVKYKLAIPLVHFSLLLVPTFLMGASLPLLSRGLVRRTSRAARTIGMLYGLNTIGAALGAFTAVWWMIGAFGFVGTTRVAALLNLVAAAGALWIARNLKREESSATTTTADTAPGIQAVATGDVQFRVGGWALLYWLSGFIALSLEILWFRVLDVSIKQSPYTFGHLLGVFLVFLGIGGIAGALAVGRSRRPGRTFLWGQWLVSVSAGLAVVLVSRLPADGWLLGGLHTFWTSDMGIVMDELRRALSGEAGEAGEAGRELIRRAIQIYGLLPLALIALPTFLMGWTFAFVQRAVQTDPRQVGWRVGLIQTANIVGAIAGSLLTGALLLSKLGTPATFKVLLLLGATFGWLAAIHTLGRFRWPGLIVVLVVSLSLVGLIPERDAFWARFHGSNVDAIIVSEDASSIVTLQHATPAYAVMRVNGAGHSVIPLGGPRTILGVLPTLIHADPRNVLLIGLGVGNTAWAAGAVPEIESLEVYEIAKPEQDVLLAHQDRWFNVPEVPQLFGDPRFRLHFSDGRLALRLSDKRYDMIEIDALEPYMAYSGNLYSQEFFELALDRLTPGGLFCTYTPTSRTRRTMVAAFPHVLSLNVPGYLHFMLGSNKPIVFDRESVLRRLADSGVQAWLGESAADSNAVIRRYVLEAEAVTIGDHNRAEHLNGDVNTDLYPRDEFDKTVPLEGD